jgi:cytoskeleton protein RodZ
MIGTEFRRKKIDTLTLGEKMRKIRSERRLSFYEISKSTRIQIKYLEYLENGEYSKLPADVYVKGFLKTYASFVGISEKSLIKLYEREKGIHKNIKKTDDQEKLIEPVRLSRLVITPKILIASFVILLVISGFFYLYREINTFIAEPKLVVTWPADGETIEGNAVDVKGLTERDSQVFINDQPVLINDEGEFSESVGLQGGLNTIFIRSKNKFEKESSRVITVQASIQEISAEKIKQENPNYIEEDNMLELEVTVRPDPTWLSVEADGSVVFSGTLLSSAIQKFQAKEKISVTSGKGNGTYIKINGKDIGALSNDPGIVRDVTFTADSKY